MELVTGVWNVLTVSSLINCCRVMDDRNIIIFQTQNFRLHCVEIRSISQCKVLISLENSHNENLFVDK